MEDNITLTVPRDKVTNLMMVLLTANIHLHDKVDENPNVDERILDAINLIGNLNDQIIQQSTHYFGE